MLWPTLLCCFEGTSLLKTGETLHWSVLFHGVVTALRDEENSWHNRTMSAAICGKIKGLIILKEWGLCVGFLCGYEILLYTWWRPDVFQPPWENRLQLPVRNPEWIAGPSGNRWNGLQGPGAWRRALPEAPAQPSPGSLLLGCLAACSPALRPGGRPDDLLGVLPGQRLWFLEYWGLSNWHWHLVFKEK